jgi:hypothetical protein
MPKTNDELAEDFLKLAGAPRRRDSDDLIPDTPFTQAHRECSTLDEKIILFANTYDVEALPSWIRFNRWDAMSLKKAASEIAQSGMEELAAVVRAAIPSVRLKVAAHITAKQQAQKASKRAYLKALAKARRK